MRVISALLLLLAALAAPAPAEEPPLAIAAMGSFHIGGREAQVSGRPAREVVLVPGARPMRIDPNGIYRVEGLYAQFHHPARRQGQVPLLLWHGGGMTGVVWETTPDGREGWQHYFLRRGWSVYVSDAVERGRAGWAMSPEIFAGEPIFLSMADPWERFRIGPGPGSFRGRVANPGSQFPVEAYGQLMAQMVPRWTTTDAAQLAAYIALLERVGPAVVVAHAQGAMFALRAAQARPGLLRALVLVEPSGFGESTPAALAALRGIPILALYGDFIEQDPRWTAIRNRGTDFFAAAQNAGASVEVLDLPDAGIAGNSHLMMMERNNGAVAARVQEWLAVQGLWRAE
jgi:pimeloyl-ACP methyl ester carboxylesterase